MAKMWFGTRAQMQWVPQVDTGPAYTKSGWNSEALYVNGGAKVRNSTAAHMSYNMVWGPIFSRDNLRPISDYKAGIFGDGLIYFLDPTAMDKNALPQHWAFPAQAGDDAPTLYADQEPTIVATPANTNLYPIQSAKYTIEATSQSVYVPIPPGYCAWVGAHGTSNGTGGVRVTPFLPGDIGSTVSYPTLLSVTSSTRVNASFDSATYAGIEVALGSTGAGAATTVTLSGLMVQILPSGVTPSAGGFISGQGHSGCSFSGEPVQTPYTINSQMERVGMTARLVEVGGWL
jgi:hypothetical protein